MLWGGVRLSLCVVLYESSCARCVLYCGWVVPQLWECMYLEELLARLQCV